MDEDSERRCYEQTIKDEAEIIKGTYSWENIYESFARRCQLCTNKLAMGWVEGGTERKRITFGEMHQQVRSLARNLTRLGIAAGDRVILCYPPGLDVFLAFWACLCNVDSARKLQAIVKDSQASMALTESGYLAALETGLVLLRKAKRASRPGSAQQDQPLSFQEGPFDEAGTFKWGEEEGPVEPLVKSRHDTAFLQYTSGSTGEPKGVMVTHAALAENVLCTTQVTQGSKSFESHRSMIGVSWLPHFHDMGLISFHMSPIVAGVPVIYFSP
eukprot:g65561.t1